MTDKELRKLSRAELIDILFELQTQNENLTAENRELAAQLESRQLQITEAGAIAEAALRLNGVFEAAEAACRQYTDNIRLLSERQEAVCQQMKQDALREAEEYQAETERRCAKLEMDTKLRCADMVMKAKSESQQYWDDVAIKLEAFYNEHAGLRELLSVAHPKTKAL